MSDIKQRKWHRVAGPALVLGTLLASLPAPALAAAARPPAARPAAALPASAPAASPAVAVRYTFDAGPGVAGLTDVRGRYPLRAVGTGAHLIDFERRGDGRAVRYPNRCTGTGCPRAILEGPRAPELNPGTRPLRFGATLRMTPGDTAPGANVVQKGYATTGTQYKLQVDGHAGRPSCVVAGGSAIYRVVAPVRVADDRWHQVSCVRAGGALRITVNGVHQGSVAVPLNLSISNDAPLRIGGKNTAPDNDQYAGRIDEVFVSIS